MKLRWARSSDSVLPRRVVMPRCCWSSAKSRKQPRRYGSCRRRSITGFAPLTHGSGSIAPGSCGGTRAGRFLNHMRRWRSGSRKAWPEWRDYRKKSRARSAPARPWRSREAPMVIFTLMFAGLMLLSAESRRRFVAISLIGCVAVLVVAPTPAPGQLCLPCIIQAVLDTVSKVIGNWLNLITGVLTDIRNFYQQTVWPLNLINQAKAQIMAMIAQFRGRMQGIFSTNPHTATLPNPAALEIILRNRQTGDLGSVGQVYVNAFRPVPQAGLMAPQDRDMTDMDDAMAQNNLKTLKMSDQAQDLMLQAADQIENLAGDPDINHMAPGTAAFLTASAVVASVKSEAIMQKMLAAVMRQEAARIAHDNALRKRRSALAVQLQNDMTNIDRKSVV